MKQKLIGAFAAACIMALASTSAQAANCNPSKKAGDDLSPVEAQAVYDCLKGDLHKGYMKGGKGWIPAAFVKNYQNWTIASKYPAAPGFHGSRFLVTYVNKVGAAEYLKFKEENVNIPAGTVIAKESFKVTAKGKVRKGPLFFMQKTKAGKSPKTMDWYYMAVSPGGKPMKINPVKACSKCHLENFSDRGGLGYPIEEARVGN
ncbi:MAG: cytochrome P460 family protein [Proteobacteria bacterium]|nr:cytochrome P460 family protein [Pseudomonadota bacterium]